MAIPSREDYVFYQGERFQVEFYFTGAGGSEGAITMRRTKTYMDKLMANQEFRKRFDEEYQNLCVGEQIARARHEAHLTQAALAKRAHTTKSAISRYESASYGGYSIPLLTRIAKACGAELKIVFVAKQMKDGTYPSASQQ
jgi:DNA-binding XRE family transcriptional regulator